MGVWQNRRAGRGSLNHSCLLRAVYLKRYWSLAQEGVFLICFVLLHRMLVSSGPCSFSSWALLLKGWAEYTGFWAWWWQYYSGLEIYPSTPPNLSLHLSPPSSLWKIFSSWDLQVTVFHRHFHSLMSLQIQNNWHLNSREQPTVQTELQLHHSRASCLKQMKCWLVKGKQVKWGRSEHWCLFVYFTYIDNFS